MPMRSPLTLAGSRNESHFQLSFTDRGKFQQKISHLSAHSDVAQVREVASQGLQVRGRDSGLQHNTRIRGIPQVHLAKTRAALQD